MRHGPQSTLSYQAAGRLTVGSILLGVMLFFSLSCGHQVKPPPEVVGGSIDLTQWDFEQDGPVTLSGDWHFWWEALHPPESFVGGRLPLEAKLAPVPKSWAHYEGGDDEPSEKPVAGYATYALSLKLPSARDKSLTILQSDLRDSGRIFLVNKEWLMSSDESGKVGHSYDSYVPLRSRMSLEVGAGDGTEVFLVVQVASFVGGLAEGFTSPPVIHTKSSAVRYLGRKNAKDFWVQGVFLIMGLYHLALYFFRRKETTNLWSALMMLVMMIRIVLDAGHLDRMVEPTSAAYYVWRINTELFAFYCLPLLFILYFSEKFQIEIPRLTRSFVFVAVGFSLVQAILPYPSHQLLWPFFIPVCGVQVCLIIALVWRAYRMGRYGAGAMLLTLGVVFISIIHDAAIFASLLDSAPISAFTLVGYVLVQSVVLSRQFSLSVERSERLALELKDEHELLEFELGERRRIEGELGSVRNELVRSEELLVTSQKMASIGELVASIGHELANPLWAVGGARERVQHGAQGLRDFMKALVGDDQSDGAMQAKAHFNSQIREIEEAIEAQALAVDHMSEISMALRKNARLDREAVPVDIPDVLSDSLVLVAGKLKPFDVDKEINTVSAVDGYPGKLAQVFTNLLSNAADALTDNRDGKVSVCVKEKDWEGKAGVSVLIEDSGPGVPVELRDKVTEMFFTTKPVGVGTGLGLGISIRIVRSHGGRMVIDSSSDLGGALFEVWLPLPKAQSQDDG